MKSTIENLQDMLNSLDKTYEEYQGIIDAHSGHFNALNKEIENM